MEELIKKAKKVLQLVYILLIVIFIFLIMYSVKMTGLISFFKTIIKILSPLFIGIVISWLLEPVVQKLIGKKIGRLTATLIVYTISLIIIVSLTWIFIREIYSEVNNFIVIIPNVIDEISGLVDRIFVDIPQYESIKLDIYSSINNIKNSIVENLPASTMNAVKSIVSNFATFAIGFLIAFYLTITKKKDRIINKLNSDYQKDAKYLSDQINTSLRTFVISMLTLAGILGIVLAIVFKIIGLRAPILFGFICAVTDLIPYIGPYIGGGIAVIVAFSMSMELGLITLIVVLIVQVVQSFIFAPLIMSKTMKVSPLTVVLGLMVFGHYFGIVGMLLATPIIATTKIVALFLNKRFNIWSKLVGLGNWLKMSD